MGQNRYPVPDKKSVRMGWVYILTNPAMPGLVKIGCTGRTPTERARDLSDKTGVPARFVVAWACPVSDWQAVEGLTHIRLGDCRPNRGREFFACSVDQGRRAITRAARAYMRPAWLRLLIGPRRVVARPPSLYRRPTGDGLLVVTLAATLVAVLLVWLQPTPPSWLPASVRVTVGMIERL
jgi:hypothetical protein